MDPTIMVNPRCVPSLEDERLGLARLVHGRPSCHLHGPLYVRARVWTPRERYLVS
jgi:hypothetical protein